MEEANENCCAVSRPVSEDASGKAAPQHIKKSSQAQTTQDMVRIEGGSFLMGTNSKEGFPADGEGPIRKMNVDSFYMDPYTVTNAEFKTFIDETGYQTDAERFGWSFVFYMLISEETMKTVDQKVQNTPWWYVVNGADWAHPEGPETTIADRLDHPVVHISWNDTQAYCAWSGKRLLTETEWEYAARGGLQQKTYAWGDELTPNDEHYCNIWQGTFPEENTLADGYLSTAPVHSFPPNGYGLYQMAGNVWEWCSDWFAINIHHRGGKDNPQGAEDGETRVMRGGSYLCHKSYCNRYRVAARSANTPDSSTGNLGFRTAKDV